MTPRRIHLSDEAETRRLASAMAERAAAGDIFLLSGEIGAGKSAFARAFIRHHLGPDEDVPSPTFTLVQTYETPDAEIWHCDLYRLTDPQEVMELGLDDAMRDAICLIEWPEKLAGDAPSTAVKMQFVANLSDHQVTITAPSKWDDILVAYDA